MKKKNIIDVISNLHHILESTEELSAETRSKLETAKNDLQEAILCENKEILTPENAQLAISVLITIWEMIKQQT